MAIQYIGTTISGVASDTKPTLTANELGVLFVETDTDKLFQWDGDSWDQIITSTDVAVGALNSGSITSGFTSIDVGSGAITTTGTITAGELTVTGNTTTVSSTNTIIEDRLIELANGAGSSTADAGIIIERGSTGDNAVIMWDESADTWTLGTTQATGASTGDLSITAGTLVANLTGNASGTAATVTGAAQASITSLGTLTSIELGATDTTLARASAGDVNIEGNIIYRAGGTDVPVTDGGTGASTLTDGGVLLGSGTSAITAMAVLADGEMIVGDGTTDPVAESGATLRTSIGVGTGDSPQFTDLTLTDDLTLNTDSAVFNMGAGNDFTITHDGTTGATLAGNPITITSGGAATWSSSAGALTITSAAAATWSTAAGILTIDGDDGIVLQTTGAGGVSILEDVDLNDNDLLNAGHADNFWTDAGMYINSGATNAGLTLESTDAGSYIYLKDNSTSATSYIGVEGNNTVFQKAGTNKMILDANGNLAIGASPSSSNVVNIAKTDTAAARSLVVQGALTLPSGGGNGEQIRASGTIATPAESTVYTTISTVRIHEPTITLGSGSSLTNSASLYITGAADEATNDYALWVDAGATRFDGNVGIGTGTVIPDSKLHIYSGSAGSIAADSTSLLTLEDDADVRLTILTPDDAQGGLVVGDGGGSGSATIGQFLYNHSNNSWDSYSAGALSSRLSGGATPTLKLSGAGIIANTSGNLTIDSAADIILDAAGNNILPDADLGAHFGQDGTRWSTIWTRDVRVAGSPADIADHNYHGLTAWMLAGAAIGAFDLVCVHTTTGEIIVADASAYATARVIGICLADPISDTNEGTILLQGFIRDNDWSWTTGDTLYLSTTAGDLTATAPSGSGDFVVPVGIALSPDIVYINPSMTVIEHA